MNKSGKKSSLSFIRTKKFVCLIFAIFLVLSITGCSSGDSSLESSMEAGIAAQIRESETGSVINASSSISTTAASTQAQTETATSEAASTEASSSAEEQTKPAPERKMIALTFDDGPDTGNTYATTSIVNTMEQYGTRCTFFVVAQAVDEWFTTSGPEQMKRAIGLGCEIGTHSYYHSNFNNMDAESIQAELTKSCDSIEAACGVRPSICRTPYGEASTAAKHAIDMPIIQWSVDTLDWDSKNADSIVQQIQANVSPGSIVLMHDIYSSTAEAVERIVPWLLEQGYELVTVTELMDAYGTPLNNHYEYYDATTYVGPDEEGLF